MRGYLLIGLAALLFATIATAGTTSAQDTKNAKPFTVILKKGKELRTDLVALPRLQPNGAVSAVVAAKINASLARLDRQVLIDARDCRRAEARLHSELGGDVWQRSVDIPMQGPRFLSILVDDGYDCGGPHPDDNQLALVYDLLTGNLIDWKRLLPSTAKVEVIPDVKDTPIQFVTWSPLQQRALKAADKDCEHLFQKGENVPFLLWLDAKEHAVMFAPAGFVHYNSAMCGSSHALTLKEARRLGIAPDVTNALESGSAK